MNVLEKPRRAGRVFEAHQHYPTVGLASLDSPYRFWFVSFFILLTTGLIFCHGCHAGEHDDELSIPLTRVESRSAADSDTD